MNKTYFKTSEVARLLGINQRTVVAWCREGRLPAARPGGRNFLIAYEDLEAFLKGEK